MKGKYFRYFCVLMALAMMVFASGCNDGEDGEDGQDGQDGVCKPSPRAKWGVFLDSAVEGLAYLSGEQAGFTDKDGKFCYDEGESVTFKIGDIVLGTVLAKSTMTPLDLVPDAQSYKDTTVTNILRFLQTLDDDKNPNNGILIEPYVGYNAEVDFALSQEAFEAAAEPIIDGTFSDDRDLVSVEEAQQHFRFTLVGVPDSEIALKLQDIIDTGLQAYNVPGMSLSVITPSGIEWMGVGGITDVETQAPVTKNTLFRIGSITKSFTAMTIVQLAQEGELNLDDSVEYLLPGVVPCPPEDESEDYTGYNGNEITVRDLLQHTSGIFNYTSAPEYGEVWSETGQFTPEELVDIALANDPSSHPDEPEWHYSNTNYILLGMIIEQITGNTWEAEVRRRFIEPLNMTNTIVPETGEAVMPGDNYAHGYYFYEGAFGELNTVSDPSQTWSAGNIISTSLDVARWLNAIATGVLFNDFYQDKVLTDMVDTGIGYDYGYAVAMDEYGLFGHKGKYNGYEALMRYDLETGASVAFCANRVLTEPPDYPQEIILQTFTVLLGMDSET